MDFKSVTDPGHDVIDTSYIIAAATPMASPAKNSASHSQSSINYNQLNNMNVAKEYVSPLILINGMMFTFHINSF